jgi:hypothetical protein
MDMEEARPGVDYHEDGCDLPAWLLVCLLAAVSVPVGLTAFLLVVVLR